MNFEPARSEDIAQACAALAALAPLPEKIMGGLAASDADALRGAVTHLIDANRTRGLREIIQVFRPTRDWGVFARVQSSRLHRLDGDFAAALGDLEEVTALFPKRAAPHWWVGRALCLDALGRVEEAEAVARDGAARFPENLQATAFVAQWCGRRGRWRDASAVWDELFARLDPDSKDMKPEWWADRARARYELGQDEAAEDALAELERRFPASPLAARERLRTMRDREYGLAPIRALLAQALAHFPDDPEFRAHNVTILLSEGRLDEAEAEAVALEAGGDPEAALSARLRVEEDRGERHLRAFAEGLTARVVTVSQALRAVASLLGARAPWAFEIAERVLAHAAEIEPGNIRLVVGRAHVKIAQRRDEEALAAIDALPAHHQRRDYLELRAWAHVQRGEDARAKALWDEALASLYFPAVHGPLGDMKRISPDDRPPPGEGVTAYVVLRNEAALIPAFLDHHRRLGVRRFVFCDHLSTDESRALALSQPDVVVYDCPGSYQLTWSGRRWINEIVAREGARGWGLQLDIDEHLVYPGCERVNIDRFVSYLDAEGFEGVRGYMLDVFPARLLDAEGAARAAVRLSLVRRRLLSVRPAAPALPATRRGRAGAAVRGQGVSAQDPDLASRRRQTVEFARDDASSLRRRDERASALQADERRVARPRRDARTCGAVVSGGRFGHRRDPPPRALRRASRPAVERRSRSAWPIARDRRQPRHDGARADDGLACLSGMAGRLTSLALSGARRRQRGARGGPWVGMAA